VQQQLQLIELRIATTLASPFSSGGKRAACCAAKSFTNCGLHVLPMAVLAALYGSQYLFDDGSVEDGGCMCLGFRRGGGGGGIEGGGWVVHMLRSMVYPM
jgi:hypothetical protein